eukprot:840629-Amphidinium_carterae.1
MAFLVHVDCSLLMLVKLFEVWVEGLHYENEDGCMRRHQQRKIPRHKEKQFGKSTEAIPVRM